LKINIDAQRVRNPPERVWQIVRTTPSGWTPLHYTDKKIYVAGGTLELDYRNAVTDKTLGTPSWVFDKVRVYIPSPSGNVGTAELVPSATVASAHKYLVYHYDHLGSIQAITSWGETSLNVITPKFKHPNKRRRPLGGGRRPSYAASRLKVAA
jgi:hypothetical protein